MPLITPALSAAYAGMGNTDTEISIAKNRRI
jgi:hypothetical protein